MLQYLYLKIQSGEGIYHLREPSNDDW